MLSAGTGLIISYKHIDWRCSLPDASFFCCYIFKIPRWPFKGSLHLYDSKTSCLEIMKMKEGNEKVARKLT